MQEIIEKWKAQKIAYAEFHFSCGGDSMNDTNLLFHDEKGEVVEFAFATDESGLTDYFDNEVYNQVQFYEASDGHYMGESGIVRIELSDEEDDFIYTKSAQSEWCERYSGETLCEVTKEEADFLTEYIGGMSHTNWNGVGTDYKKDFILTEENEEMIKELHDKFQDCANDWTPEHKGEITDDSVNYNTAEDEGENGLEIVEQEGKLYVKLYVDCEVYEYSDSED
jgi:hypothetical protein